MHLICTPKFCTSIVFNLSWDGCIYPGELKNKGYANFWGQKRCIMGNVETSSLPNDSMRTLVKQIEIFSCKLTVYFNCMYLSIYTRELLGCLLGISPSERNPCRGGATSTNVKKESKREEAKKSAMADATKATTHFVTWPSPRPHWRVRKTTFYLKPYQVVILECSVCGSKYCTGIAGVQQRQQLPALQNSCEALIPKKGPAERISADTKKCGYQNTVKCQLYTQRLNNFSTLSLPEYEGLSLSKGAFHLSELFGQPVVIRISLLIKTHHPDQSKPKHYAQRR